MAMVLLRNRSWTCAGNGIGACIVQYTSEYRVLIFWL